MAYPTVRRGSRGANVKTAQTRLTAHGHTLTADGVFGPNTERKTRAFQKAAGLTADGIIGTNTWRALTAPTRAEMDSEARKLLARLGWRVNTTARYRQAVRDYQAMNNLTALTVDGITGPKTLAALRESEKRRAAGVGDISAHFSAREFACKCGGKYADCRRIWAPRLMVQAAERARAIVGPYTPLSACRCVGHNAAVGGYSRSQHLHGLAIDFRTPAITPDRARAAGLASAIGVQRRTGLIRHIDERAYGPDNYPPAPRNRSSPYVYYYG